MSADKHTFDHVTPQTDEEMVKALEDSLVWIKARRGALSPDKELTAADVIGGAR